MNQPVQKTVWRKLDGIVVLDKAQGSTSNKVLQIVKRLYAADKAGHTGSLDPLATGVLPICFGEATKVSQYLLDSDKAYIAHVKLGVVTTTSDAEGDVVSTHEVPALTEARINEVLQTFVGAIEQSPSIYSALKQNGVPLYKLARAGKEIIPKLRTITIYSIKLLEWQSPQLVIEVSCSKGTYIRTLAEDIGKVLGCGGHITQLRRTKAGPFTLNDAHTLEQLQGLGEQGAAVLDALLIAADQAIDWMPALELDPNQTRKLQQGQSVVLPEHAPEALVRVYADGKFIGIASLGTDKVLKVVRLMQYDTP